jgi:hypothetical protein
MMHACACHRPHHHIPAHIEAKAAASILGADTTGRMVAYTSSREAEVAAWAREVFGKMGTDLTQAEAAAIAELGGITPAVADRTDAALETLNAKLTSRWADTMRAAVASAPRNIRELLTPEVIAEWTGRRAQTILSGFSDGQSRAIRALINYHSTIEPLSQASLARLLRPILSLTEGQTVSLLKRRAEHQAEGIVGDTLDLRLTREAGRMVKQRAQVIARTELASAWNGGAQVTMERAEDSGAFSAPLVKTWRAQPGKPCPICAGLSGRSVALRADFDGAYSLPPAHPSCRCVVLYQEAT